jgi:hypothetical protein
MNMSKLAPTLIVGLGGIGSKIVAKVSAMITDERQRQRINFVAFDTDVNELEEIKRKDSKIKTVQTSTSMTVGDYLHYDEHTRETSFPVNPNLYRKTLSEGAGQVRAISHLAFVTAMKRGYLRELDNAIYDLYKLESQPRMQALRVIIVSTLVGGTGSGLILPVSMYIKQFLKTKMQIPGNISRGFFMLPEILYDTITAEPMRNVLRANAYAVLRELNAFILKADNNLPKRYKDKVHLEFPRIGTGEFEEYDVLPMDFCFMFDAQNIGGVKLNSMEQYLNHAATCIYAQSIGPMNTRSNSSEDNTIRALVSGQSRNRYAGAGASKLVYPSDHVLRYIALKWAAQTVSEHWTVFDRECNKKIIENNQARLKGLNVSEINRATEYVRSVDMSADNENGFALLTRNASYRFDKDGLTRRSCKWNEYIDALGEFVKVTVSKGRNVDIDNCRESAQSAVGKLTGGEGKIDIDDFKTAYNRVLSYKQLVSQSVSEVGRVAAYELFKFSDGVDITAGELNTQIEKYLIDNGNEFMHPNAARYFLYQTLQALEKKLESEKRKKEGTERAFKGFDSLFDDPNTDTVIEGISNFTSKIDDAGLWARVTKKYESDIKKFIGEYESIIGVVDGYRIIAPYVTVLESAVTYIKKLCKSFESFYTSFESNVKEIERQIKTSEEKYRLDKGNTIRYVCSSKKCLDKFYKKMEFAGNAMRIDGDLCKRIFGQVKNFASAPEINTDKISTFFKDIFNNEILQYFKTSVKTSHGPDIDMDIIRALEVEAEFEEEIEEHGRIIDYVKKTIKETQKLSDPFINRPLGEDPVPIKACAFNKNLILTDNPERENLVQSELLSNDISGVKCDKDEIGKNEILFYSAIYGLFPYDLQKFSPPKPRKDGTPPPPEAGEYHKAYFDMINRIEPDTLTTPVITPHLHKHWHLISEMPDLNDELQQEQERNIYKAFILGILYRQIQYTEAENGDQREYSLWLKGCVKSIKLEVSNGTSCDTFYELVDALTINPVIVEKILGAVDNELESARKNNILNFERSALYEGINKLAIREFSGHDRQVSIFSIAAAFKATMPQDEFIAEQGLMLMEVALETLYKQMEILVSENERIPKYISLIESQLDLFTKDIEMYKVRTPNILKGNYLRELVQVVIKVLTDKGFAGAAKMAEEFKERQFNEDAQTKTNKAIKADMPKAEEDAQIKTNKTGKADTPKAE